MIPWLPWPWQSVQHVMHAMPLASKMIKSNRSTSYMLEQFTSMFFGRTYSNTQAQDIFFSIGLYYSYINLHAKELEFQRVWIQYYCNLMNQPYFSSLPKGGARENKLCLDTMSSQLSMPWWNVFKQIKVHGMQIQSPHTGKVSQQKKHLKRSHAHFKKSCLKNVHVQYIWEMAHFTTTIYKYSLAWPHPIPQEREGVW